MSSHKPRDHLEDLAVEDNIRTDLREIGWKGMDWLQQRQDRGQWWAIVNMIMNFRIP
jgi:hypothetical protein